MILGLKVELHDISDGGIDAAGRVDKPCCAAYSHHVRCPRGHGLAVVVLC